MNLRIPSLVILFLLTFSGCLDETEQESSGWALRENATYDVEILGIHSQMHVELQWMDSKLFVQVNNSVGKESVGLPPAAPAGNLTVDGRTGQRLLLSSERSILHPLGSEKFVPSLYRVMMRGEPEFAMAPIGPQLVWLQQGNVSIGATHVNGSRQGNHWRVETTSPCPFQCQAGQASGSPPSDAWRWTMRGTWGRLLPDLAEGTVLSQGNKIFHVTLTLNGTTVQGSQFLPTPMAPVLPAPGPCEIPCEPDSWPANRSFIQGLDRIHASPAWLLWATQDQVRITSAFATQGKVGLSSNGPNATLPQFYWSATYAKLDSREFQVFDVRDHGLPGMGPLGAPVVAPLGPLGPIPDYDGLGYEDQFAGIDAIIAAIPADCAGAIDSIYLGWSSDKTGDVDHRVKFVASMESGAIAYVSPRTAEPWFCMRAGWDI